jgi:adenylate cyclase
MAQPRKKNQGALLTLAIGVAVVVALFVFDARYPSLLNLLELKAFDLRLYARGTHKPHGEVVIVALDDKSIHDLGRWPWPRTVFAQLADALKKYDVAVVGYDMVFSERDDIDLEREHFIADLRNSGVPPDKLAAAASISNDAAFANAIRAQGEMFVGYPLEIKSYDGPVQISPGFVANITPPEPLSFNLVRSHPGISPPVPEAVAYLPNLPIINSAARGSGYFNSPSDADAVCRSEMMVIKFGNRYREPLILAVISAYANHALTSLSLEDYGVARLAVGPLPIPVDEAGRMLVNFRGPAHTFPYYSVSDVIAHRVPAQALAGKIVLVGASALGVGDRWSTPMGANFPGVEIHANAIDDILTGDFIQRTQVTQRLEQLAAAVMGIAVSVAVAYLSASWSGAATAALIFGYFAFAQYLLVADGLLLGVVLPIVTTFVTYGVMVSYRYVTEGRKQRFLRHAFEHYLHPDVIEGLVQHTDALKLGGERRHMSILFADIVGFTSRSERTPPEELVALLNTYMTAMIDVILRSGGVVDKLMGDGIMAFWGAPGETPNPARSSIECALGMLGELERLRKSDPRFADVDVGIGIATGDAIVGNFGGQQRFDYSAIGDTVNLASRIEGLTRHFKVHLLVNRQTLEEAADGFIARNIGMVRVKGKVQAVQIDEVAGKRGSAVDPAFYEQFASALSALEKGSMHQALSSLEELGQQKPEDRPLQIYLERLHSANGNGNLMKRFNPFKRKSGAADGARHLLFELDTK